MTRNGYFEVDGEVGVVDVSYPVGHVRRYGVEYSEDVEDTLPPGNDEALSNAEASAGACEVPLVIDGLIKFSTAREWNGLSVVFTPGGMLRPTSAVESPVITYDNPINEPIGNLGYPRFIQDLRLDGAETDGRIGFRLGAGGDLAPTTSVDLIRPVIFGFDGDDGVGLWISDAVDCTVHRPILKGNHENLVWGGSVGELSTHPTMPTTVYTLRGNIRQATSTTTGGCVLKSAFGCVMDHPTIESNAAAAVFSANGVDGGTIAGFAILRPYFERNWIQYESEPATRSTKYTIDIDGTGTSTSVEDLEIVRPYMYNEACKLIHLHHVANYELRGGKFPPATGGICIDGDSHGRILNWPRQAGTDFEDLLAVDSGAYAWRWSRTDYVTGGGCQTFGDVSTTLTWFADPALNRWPTALTANRTVTLADLPADVGNGARFTISRRGGGAFNLNVQRADTTLLLAMATNTVAEFIHDGTAWQLF